MKEFTLTTFNPLRVQTFDSIEEVLKVVHTNYVNIIFRYDYTLEYNELSFTSSNTTKSGFIRWN